MKARLPPIDLVHEADFDLGDAQVQPALRLFRLSGVEQTVEPRVMQVLVALARRTDEVVSRDELVVSCWDSRVIGEDAIQRAVAKVRKLGAASGAFSIETIPRVGYRLTVNQQVHTECSPAGGRTNLPRRLEAPLGRDEELTQIDDFLGEANLITITGPGGVGKTRLAIEVGRRAIGKYEDGVWFIELAPLADPAVISSTIASALGVQLSNAGNSTDELVEGIRCLRVLLVLDNCEHLIDSIAELADAVLRQTDEAKLLVTSQEPLGIASERVFRLSSLSEAAAVELFTLRARAADANFVDTLDNSRIVQAICSRLDGIPLAIEMAAARAPAFGCQELLDRLDDRFRLLTGGHRTALPRHRTLHATLDWSHSLLNETEAKVFRRLGVLSPFSSDYTLDEIVLIASSDDLEASTVLDALASLVEKSLVVVDHEEGHPRYRLLETMRAYAQEKLAAAGEKSAIQRDFTKLSTRPYYSINEISPAHFTEFNGAILRAAHQLDATEPKIFKDELALPLTGLSASQTLAYAKRTKRFLQDQLAPIWLLRGRYAEDQLHRLRSRVQRRITQYVILAAGLTASGLANAGDDLQVFEVDEVPLQQWKRDRLAELGTKTPEQLHFAACDLEQGAPGDTLGAAGYSSFIPAFIWLNGMHQVSMGALIRILEWAVMQAKGSEVLLNYVVPCALAEEVKNADSPRGLRWCTFFTPEAITDLLHKLGFRRLQHLTEEEANQRYFSGRSDDLCAPFLERLVCASVD